jgi:hypothetical protein
MVNFRCAGLADLTMLSARGGDPEWPAGAHKPAASDLTVYQ